MQMLYGHSEAVMEFAGHLIAGGDRGFENGTGIGVVDKDGNLVASLVYHNWDPESGVIEMTIAATDSRWMTRGVIRAAFLYPFAQIGCQMVVFRRDADDERLAKLWKGFGITEHEIPRLGGRDKSKIIGTLTDEAFFGSKWMRH